MKKIFFILVAAMMSQISIAQQATITSGVSKADYQKMTGDEKRISDYVDSAIAGLKGLKLNNSTGYANYQATVNVSKNAADKFNFIAIAPAENTPAPSNIQSCTICGISSGITCYKRIITQLQNGGVVIITVALNSDGCGVLTWN